MPLLSVKTDRQMAAARAEQSEQRERDECEFHLVPLAVGQRGLNNFNAVDRHRTLKTNRPAPDPQHSIETVLKKPRRPAWVWSGLPLCPGRQTDPAQHKRTGELVSERLRELVSERLSSARTAPVVGNAPNRPSIADEMPKEHRRLLGE